MICNAKPWFQELMTPAPENKPCINKGIPRGLFLTMCRNEQRSVAAMTEDNYRQTESQ